MELKTWLDKYTAKYTNVYTTYTITCICISFILEQMAYSYVVMQSLPSTYQEFANSSNSISTFASIIYGKKKYVHVYVVFYWQNVIILLFNTDLLGKFWHQQYLSWEECQWGHLYPV